MPESAANDGLAYPFISISLYLLLEARVQDAFKKWVLIGCLCKCFFNAFTPGTILIGV
jgi:NhaP-type Na+/H+ or K+/H+ antiporter